MSLFGRILIVEDDPRDVELTLTALSDYNLANEVVVTRDGAQALDYLYSRGEFKDRPSERSYKGLTRIRPGWGLRNT